MHQNISALKQNRAIKLIEISRVTNSIRAFLFLDTRQAAWKWFSSSTCPSKFILELVSPMQLLFLCCSAPSEMPAASAQPSSPHLYLAQINLLKNKPRKKDSNLKRHGKGNGQK